MPSYSKHAIERMQQRRIGERDVELALSRPIGQPLAGRGGTMWIRGPATGGPILKVLVRAADPEFVITTVWEDV